MLYEMGRRWSTHWLRQSRSRWPPPHHQLGEVAVVEGACCRQPAASCPLLQQEVLSAPRRKHPHLLPQDLLREMTPQLKQVSDWHVAVQCKSIQNPTVWPVTNTNFRIALNLSQTISTSVSTSFSVNAVPIA